MEELNKAEKAAKERIWARIVQKLDIRPHEMAQSTPEQTEAVPLHPEDYGYAPPLTSNVGCGLKLLLHTVVAIPNDGAKTTIKFQHTDEVDGLFGHPINWEDVTGTEMEI